MWTLAGLLAAPLLVFGRIGLRVSGEFKILPVEWTAESEELTPTLKMRRKVVNTKYAPQIEQMYSG